MKWVDYGDFVVFSDWLVSIIYVSPRAPFGSPYS